MGNFLSVEFLSSAAKNRRRDPAGALRRQPAPARTKVGISQEELGDRCELHRTEISLLERAGREPRLPRIVKLAGALETTPGGSARASPGCRRQRFEVKRRSDS